MPPHHRVSPLPRALAVLAVVLGAGFAQTPTPPTVALPPGSVIEAVYEERLSPAEVQLAAASSFGRFGVPMVENAVDVFALRFVTTGLEGQTAVVRATLFVPVEPPRGSAPLYVFGSGTTGLAASCAPSREAELPQPLGDYRGYLAPYAGRGIVTVFPDYLGFDDPLRPQAYFHAASEAHVMLDAARATRALFGEAPWLGDLDDVVLMGGYSQGGHAAFAAADLRPWYAPEIPLRGLIGYGATTDVQPLFLEGPFYAPYVLASWSSIYGTTQVGAHGVLAERWLPSLEREALSVCVDRAQQIYPFDVDSMYTPAFARALRAGTLQQDFPGLHALFEENRTGLSGHGLPALVVQGGQDVIVHDATQERFVAALCARGSDVLYLNVRDARHRDTRPAGFDTAVGWILARTAGVPAPSTCQP
jgi:hypothetical protein